MCLIACWTSGEKSCAPKLTRVTPMRASTAARPRVSRRVELDCVLIEAGEIEGAAQPIDKVDENFTPEDRGSAAAPVQADDAAPADRRAQKIDFRPEEVGIGGDRGYLTHRLGGAAAVEAELAAIGNVQIERQRRLRRQRAASHAA